MDNELLTEIKSKVKSSAGKISTIYYTKGVSAKKTIIKKYGEVGDIKKNSVFQVRVGIDYENIKTVKEAHASGERERRGLPSTMEKIDKGVYHHKVKDSYYIGCSPVRNENSINRSEYHIDGKIVELDDIVITVDGGENDLSLGDILYAKDLKGHDSDWVQLEWSNIESLSSIK
jgi:hypothetical protein